MTIFNTRISERAQMNKSLQIKINENSVNEMFNVCTPDSINVVLSRKIEILNRPVRRNKSKYSYIMTMDYLRNRQRCSKAAICRFDHMSV